MILEILFHRNYVSNNDNNNNNNNKDFLCKILERFVNLFSVDVISS